MRNVGVRVLESPQGVASVYDPAIRYMDPRSGVEAALSEFDAQLATNVFFDRDDRAFNNLFVGGGANQLAFGTGGFNAEVSKRTATGTQYLPT